MKEEIGQVEQCVWQSKNSTSNHASISQSPIFSSSILKRWRKVISYTRINYVHTRRISLSNTLNDHRTSISFECILVRTTTCLMKICILNLAPANVQ